MDDQTNPNQQQEQQPQQQEQQNKGPEDTLRDGALKATIWRREGEKNDYFTTSFAKTYQDKEGNLKDAHSFGHNDLLGVAELARQAHQRTSELKREEFINSRREALYQDQTREQEAQARAQAQAQAPQQQYTAPVQERAPEPQAPMPPAPPQNRS